MKFSKLILHVLISFMLCNCIYAQSIVWSHEVDADHYRRHDLKRYLVADKYDTLYTVTTNYNGTSYDIMLYKYSSSGTQMWAKRFDSGGDDGASGSLILDNYDNIYVLGTSFFLSPRRGDIVLLKYDRFGNLIWEKTQDSINTEYYPIAMEQDFSGNLYTLNARSIHYPDATVHEDYYLMKYDQSGVLIWKSVFTISGGADRPRDLCVWGNNICVTGIGNHNSLNATMDVTGLNTNGVILWQNSSSLYGGGGDQYMPVISDGTYFYVGADIQVGPKNCIQVKKFGSWGSVLWTFVNDTASSIRRLEYDYANQRIVAGGYEKAGTVNNLYTAEINIGSGSKAWGKRYSYATNGEVRDIKVRYSNGSFGIYVLGNVANYASNSDFALVKYNSSGGIVWHIQYNGIHNGIDDPISLAFGGLTDAYITGDCGNGSYPTDYVFALMRVSNVLSSPVIDNIGNVTSEVQPDRFELMQNYPNPFNPSTSIRFALPVDDDVIIGVYDVMGQEVERLAEGRMTAGYHEIKFDGSNLSSGVYFYKITATGFTDVKKMMLTK